MSIEDFAISKMPSLKIIDVCNDIYDIGLGNFDNCHFVEEIKEQCEIINDDCLEEVESPLLCPHCKSGRLILRHDRYGRDFYGCSNYPYCNYTISKLEDAERNVRCPECKDFMIRKEGKYGVYYVCHNKLCGYKVNSGNNKYRR